MDETQKLSLSPHIPQAHDAFFKSMMSDTRVAQAFFNTHLPTDIRDRTDLNQLELQPSSYIDDARQSSIADMLFKTKIENHDAYLYTLVEHQSRVDPLMPFRVLKYTCRIIDQHLVNHKTKRLPLVLPLVVYHGKKAWNASCNINDLVEAPKELVESYFLKPFTLIDLNTIDDETIKERQWLNILEFTLKHIFEREIDSYSVDIIALLQYAEQHNGQSLSIQVLLYLLDRAEIHDKAAFVKLVQSQLSAQTGEKIMTMAEQFKQEGRKEGLQAGIKQRNVEIAKNLLASGQTDLNFIAQITGLSVAEIQSLLLV